MRRNAGVAARIAGSVAVRSRAEQSKVVREAVRFILARERHHKLKFSMEVGEHLFVNVFESDLDRYQKNSRWETTAITRIAQDGRVGLSRAVLYRCIHVHILVTQHGESFPGIALPDLSPWTWNVLWHLQADPDAVLALATWAAETKVPAKLLGDVAKIVKPFLDAGGDLMAASAPGSRRGPSGRRDTPYARIMRLLSLVGSWLSADSASMTVASLTRSLNAIDRMQAVISRRSA